MNSNIYRIGAVCLGLLAATGCQPTESIQSIDTGRFTPLAGYADLNGRAQLVRTGDDTTLVQVHVEGLAADAQYPAHVHVQPCAFGNGGAHYKIDPTVEGMVEDNELWPRVSTNADGVGRADIEVAHLARGDALSIVVHDPNNGNAKMACADLSTPAPNGWRAEGTFLPFASATDVDGAIGGRAEIFVSAAGTVLEVQLSGLDASEGYKSHVHGLPCEVNNGGGHYKFDPTVEGMEPGNEIWPTVVPSAAGRVSDTVMTAHVARADAQSVVVHRVLEDGSKPKVACANLRRTVFSPVTSRGSVQLLAAAAERAYDDLTAEASVTRDLFGKTRASLEVAGLLPNEMYMAHVHTYSCATGNGGGHYKFDTAIEGAVEDNEIWLTFMTTDDGAGSAETRVVHLARPEAQSVVIHDYVDGTRLGCIDLN